MKFKLSLVFMSFFFMVFSATLNAQIGSIEEVIEQTKNNQHYYMYNLLEKLDEQLQSFVQEQKILESSEKKIAWLLTVRSIIRAVRAGAESATSRASWVRQHESFEKMLLTFSATSLATAALAAHNALKTIAEEGEITVSLNTAIEAIMLSGALRSAINTTEGAFSPSINTTDSIIAAYNVAQWALFNNILDNIKPIVTDVFDRTLKYVYEQRKNKTYTTTIPHDSCPYFAHLNQAELSFLQAWLLIWP